VAGLKWLPYGGLYLTGGLTPKNIDLLRGEHGLFMTAFRDKGRVSGMLSPIPVYAVMVEDLGQRSVKYIHV
jgi:glucokinase